MIYNIQGQFESIFQHLWYACENEANCDVVLIAGDNGLRIAAHRLILAAASEYFRTMFRSKMLESTAKEIKISKIRADILQKLIESIYTGRVDINEDNAIELLQAAHLLLLTKVVDTCGDYLMKQLHSSNCFGFLLLAEQYQCQTILQNAKSYCLKNFATASQSEEFLKCSADQLSEILESEDLCVNSEEEVFNSVKKWIYHNPTEREEKYKAAMLKLVRLPLLNNSFLFEHVRPFCRSSAECLEMYMDALEQTISPLCNISKRKNTDNGKNVNLLIACRFENNENFKIELKYNCPTRSKWMKYSLNIGYHAAYGLCIVKDNLYIIGGRDVYNQPKNSVTYVNLKTLTSNKTNPMKKNRVNCRAVELKGFLYVLDGENSSSIEKFNPETNTWSAVAAMLVARFGCALAVLNEKLYVAGGYSNGQHLSSVECYDPEKNVWLPIKSMNKRRVYCQAAVANGLLYVIGGVRSEYSYKSVERYDPQINYWTMICSLNESGWIKSITYCDKVLVYYDDKILEYNAEKDEWVLIAIPSVGSSYLFSYSGELLKSKFTEDK